MVLNFGFKNRKLLLISAGTLYINAGNEVALLLKRPLLLSLMPTNVALQTLLRQENIKHAYI